MMMPGDDGGISGSRPQRFEIYTGAGRRRIWSSEEKVAILAESFAGHETISAVARRHGLARSQLFAWRRQCREEREAAGIAALAPVSGPMPISPMPRSPFFVPAVLAPTPVAAPPTAVSQAPRRQSAAFKAAVELEIGGVPIKIGHGADAKMIVAVIQAVRAGQ